MAESMKPLNNVTEEKPKLAPALHSLSTLLIRNIPQQVTSESLQSIFSNVGLVKRAFIVHSKGSLERRGYKGKKDHEQGQVGYVTFAMKEDAKKALENIGTLEFPGAMLGNEIRAEFAKHRKRIASSVTASPKIEEKELRKDDSIPHGKPRLILRNLPWSVRQPSQLTSLFAPYGNPVEVQIPRKGNGKMAGFAFVEMKNKAQAKRALEGLMKNKEGVEVGGRKVIIDWAIGKGEWEEIKEKEGGEMQDVEVKTEDEDEDEETEMNYNEEPKVENEDTDDEQAFKGEADLRITRPPDSRTLFIRNIPYTTTSDTLRSLFATFGALRSCLVVNDPVTGQSRGTAFVTFYDTGDAEKCLELSKDHSGEDVERFMIEGRVLNVANAVGREDAERLKEEGLEKRKNDKRNLYLLTEGQVEEGHPLYQYLTPTDHGIREESLRLRKQQLASNPSLHLSLTRLAIRNIPRQITEWDLKKLGVIALKKFKEEVAAGLREELTEDENSRFSSTPPKTKGFFKKPKVLKQSKILFDHGPEGGMRSKGYGFLEYFSHADALRGLRWLNGRQVPLVDDDREKKQNGGQSKMNSAPGKRRALVVEFAIENVEVTRRRAAREDRARQQARNIKEKNMKEKEAIDEMRKKKEDNKQTEKDGVVDRTRKRKEPSGKTDVEERETKKNKHTDEEKRIIARRRSRKRYARKTGGV